MDGLELCNFSLGGIDLVKGQKYVAFISASGLFDGVLGNASSRATDDDVLPGGGFVYLDNGNDFSQWTTKNWVVREREIWFRANFEVPTPSILMLFLLGLLGLAVSGLWNTHAQYAASGRRKA
ncbi:MAG: hypothetical protein R3E64_00010 [Halioglobus sp.]